MGRPLSEILCYSKEMTEIVHFFASHSWTHSHRRDGLHSILSPWRRGVDFQDYSISRLHPLNIDTDPELARELRAAGWVLEPRLEDGALGEPAQALHDEAVFGFGEPVVEDKAAAEEFEVGAVLRRARRRQSERNPCDGPTRSARPVFRTS